MSRVLPLVLGLGLTFAGPATAGAPLPPDAEGAKEALNTSPRHGEWVDISYTASTKIRSFVFVPSKVALQ